MRPAGEDIPIGTAALAKGRRLRPQDVALAAAFGLTEIDVTRRIRVAVFSTGDELVSPGDPRKPAQLFDSNRFMLMAMLGRLGCDVSDLGIVRDDRALRAHGLKQVAGKHDLILTTGGVSTGEEDHVKAAVESVGSLVLWRMAIKPGRPVAMGTRRSWMELLSACLFQALWASPEVLCEQVHKARGFRGQSLVAARIAAHLRTHPKYQKEIDEHQWGSHAKPVEPGVEIQDPYSVRCSPQILGAFQEALWHIEQVVERELNASTDNPLAFPETQSIIHCGNFYGQQIAMACDYLRIGLAKCALLLERQLERLVNWRYSLGLPPLLSGGDPGLNSGFAGAQLLATSLAAECRMLSAPASVQTIPTNANNQDVVSMGTISARMTRQLTGKVWKLAAIQALALAQAADLRGGDLMGRDYAKLHQLVRGISEKLSVDRPLAEDILRVRELLESDGAQAQLLPPRPPAP